MDVKTGAGHERAPLPSDPLGGELIVVAPLQGSGRRAHSVGAARSVDMRMDGHVLNHMAGEDELKQREGRFRDLRMGWAQLGGLLSGETASVHDDNAYVLHAAHDDNAYILHTLVLQSCLVSCPSLSSYQ